MHSKSLVRFKRFALSGLLLSGLTTSVLASSGQAWADHDRKVVQKCTAASGLLNTAVLSKPILFDDSVGYTALTLRGHLKPLTGKQPKATATQEKLCLYERKTGKVHIEDISSASR